MQRLGTDSGDYEILGRAAAHVRNRPGLSIEVGLREGGGSQYMVEQLFDSTLPHKLHVAVDPYGSLPYEWKQDQIAGWVYDNRMRNEALIGLYTLTLKSKVNFQFFNMTDAMFFSRFWDGVPVFEDGRTEVLNEYDIAHLDAVHSYEAIAAQVDFFAPRMTEGAIIVVDDITDFYDTDRVESHLGDSGFEVWEKGTKKGAYIKVRKEI